MALGHDHVVHAPAVAGATGVTGHAPPQHLDKTKWQVHRCGDKTLGVAAPCLKASNRTTAIRANCVVVSAIHEAAGRNILKRIPTISAGFKHAAVEAEGGILTGRLKVKIMSKC
jgi:hypothetical protein